MNRMRPHPSEPTPAYLYEVTVNGRRLARGMEATLWPERGRKEKRRYEFRYGEAIRSRSTEPTQETLFLTFHGPVRSPKRKFRTVRAEDVLTVHTKSEAR